MSSDCLFCKIVAGDIPADVVLSTDEAVAFRDINAQAPTHVLVVPKRHITNADELTADDAGELSAVFQAARQVAAQEGISGNGYRLVFNVGDDAGNTVPHLHLHVIGGRRLGWPPG